MTLTDAIQAVMASGMLGHAAVMLKWVMKVETRLAVIETKADIKG